MCLQLESLRDSVDSSPVPIPPRSPTASTQGFPDSPVAGSRASSIAPGNPLALGPRKRVLEDNSQYVNTISRSFKLRKTDKDELVKFSKGTPAEQRLWTAAMLLKVREHHELMTAPDTVWEVPSKLAAFIKRKALLMLLNPSLASYIDSPSDLKNIGPAQALLKYLEDHPSHGFTSVMAEDTSKTTTLMAVIRRAFTRVRSKLKETIDNSFELCDDVEKEQPDATDIVDLTEQVLSLPGKNQRTTISVQHCARIAFLRCVAASNTDSKKSSYWKAVDEELEATRSMGSAKKQSKFIKSVLEKDRATYGGKGAAAKVNEEVAKEIADAHSEPEDDDDDEEEEAHD